MKVLLTGYTGKLGRVLADQLKEQGYEVRVILNRTAIKRKEFPRDFEVVWGSLADPKTIKEAVTGVQAILHCAWIWPKLAQGNKTINLDVAKELWDQATTQGISHFVFVSSVAVYGMNPKHQRLLDESSPLAEGDELLNDYPAQKIEVERFLIDQAATSSTKIVIFRPGIFLNEKQSPAKSIGKLSMLIGNGRNHLPLIAIPDVGHAILKWLESDHSGGIYNVTPSQQLTNKEWFQSWCRVNQKSSRLICVPTALMRCAGFGVVQLKRLLGKPGSTQSINYALSAATRDLYYSNQSLKKDLDWTDSVTEKYYESPLPSATRF